jgi:hypothetical protein
MPRAAVLIAASPTPSFYSQIAALRLALERLEWSRWRHSVHVYIGGERDARALEEWLPHLRDVEITWVSEARFSRNGDWSQSDDVFRFAPRDADVLLAMDADTLPVASLEVLLDCISDTKAIAGVIAHYPFPLPSGGTLREGWRRVASGLVNASLEFNHSHSLVPDDAPPEERLTPFYLNFGVVGFPSSAFDVVAGRYLFLRPRIMDRMIDPDFSGQAALTLAIAETGVRTLALPMRFNFPNDARAEVMYPEELTNAVIFHYLRTTTFDRQVIFTSSEHYSAFMGLTLTGVDAAFQRAVKRIIGHDYPFARSPLGTRQT